MSASAPRPAPRGQPQQARSRFTVGAIVEATERMVSRAETISTRKIAQLAGVSVGTLYQYFPRKEAVLAAVIDRRIAEDEERLYSTVEHMRRQPLEALLRFIIESFVPKTTWERALYPALVDTLESAGRLRVMQQVLRRFERQLCAELELRRAELSEHVEPDIAATMLLHGTRAAFFALVRNHPELSRELAVEQLLRLCLGYVRSK